MAPDSSVVDVHNGPWKLELHIIDSAGGAEMDSILDRHSDPTQPQSMFVIHSSSNQWVVDLLAKVSILCFW